PSEQTTVGRYSLATLRRYLGSATACSSGLTAPSHPDHDRPHETPDLLALVSPEERVGLPARPRAIVGHLDEKSAHDLLVQGGGPEVDRLARVVEGRMVAAGEPVLEELCLGRAGLEAHVELDGRDSVADEVVLVAADEQVAERLGIRNGADAERERDGADAVTEVRVGE